MRAEIAGVRIYQSDIRKEQEAGKLFNPNEVISEEIALARLIQGQIEFAVFRKFPDSAILSNENHVDSITKEWLGHDTIQRARRIYGSRFQKLVIYPLLSHAYLVEMHLAELSVSDLQELGMKKKTDQLEDSSPKNFSAESRFPTVNFTSRIPTPNADHEFESVYGFQIWLRKLAADISVSR